MQRFCFFNSNSQKIKHMSIFSSKHCITTDQMIVIYRDHYKSLFSASFRITRNAELSEDICHDLFLDLLNRRKSTKEIHNTEAYLRRAVTNNSIKKFKQSFDFTTIDNIHSEKDTDDSIETWGHLNLDSILGAISKLPQGYRVITEKHLLDGLTHNEIASDLNIKASTSRSQYLRAKKLLRKTLLNE